MKSFNSQKKNLGKESEYEKGSNRTISPSPLACDDPAQPIKERKITRREKEGRMRRDGRGNGRFGKRAKKLR